MIIIIAVIVGWFLLMAIIEVIAQLVGDLFRVAEDFMRFVRWCRSRLTKGVTQ